MNKTIMARKKVTRRIKSNYNSQLTEYQPVSSKIQTTKQLKAKNYKQRDYIFLNRIYVISLCLGPSGVGKDYVATGMGIELFNSESSPIEKIYFIRNNIGMSNELSLGAIPGNLSDKTLQLAYPILDNLIEFMSEGQAKYLIESGKIEVLPIGMLRGRSLKNSFIIVSESQNCTLAHLKTIITRIGEGSKMVIEGDCGQVDFKDTKQSGLAELAKRLKGLSGIGIVEFTINDIVRHTIISHILERL
jgi:phosphate starvation-inducible protein PhoH and related proteins